MARLPLVIAILSRLSLIFASDHNPEDFKPLDQDPLLSNAINPSLDQNQTSPPWTYEPQCSSKTSNCVFTHVGFAQGRGISLYTTPELAQLLVESAPFVNSSVLEDANTHLGAFKVVDIPGKGKGVIASRTIERGELLMAYTPTNIYKAGVLSKEDYHLMHLATNQLPEAARERFMDLAAHGAEDGIVDRMGTNMFSGVIDEVDHYLIIPEAARFNHDCRPSAMYHFNEETLVQSIYAARTIYAGEEITVTYLDPLQPRSARIAATNTTWNFPCTCPQCSLSPSLSAASDTRIDLILNLTSILREWIHHPPSTPLPLYPDHSPPGPDTALLLVSLYEQERLWSLVADAYGHAAVAWNAMGNEWEALKWAYRAIEGQLINNGEGDRELEDLRELVSDPRGHWTWRRRVGGV